MDVEHHPVLIVGGSLVGLSTAVFLADRGIRPLLVERHADTSRYARAWGVNPRTMELYRSVGLEEAIRRAQRRLDGAARRSGILRAESLAGEEHGWFDAPYVHGVYEDSGAVSPTGWAPCPQDRLEPVLRARAGALGADLRFGTVLTGFDQDAGGVTATVEDRSTGVRRRVRAEYLVGCDGNTSAVRARLGVGTSGVGTMVHNVAILFAADLTPVLRGRAFMHCQVMNEEVTGVLGTDGERWQLDALYWPANGERFEDFTEQRCVALVRAAVGVPDLPVEILGRLPWELGARVADTFAVGRVFLAGDSAHVHPPTGGFGANTGVQDAHNLAWKLAATLTGAAGPGLLASYDAERRSVGSFTVDQAVARSLQRFRNPAVADIEAVPIVDDLTVMMGYRYHSGAVVAEPDDPGPPATVGDDYENPGKPTGRPGTRAAHVPVEHGDREVSLLDLLGRQFTLLHADDGQDWRTAADRAATALGVAVAVLGVGVDLLDPAGAWPAAYGVHGAGAVLVRPDGFIGWRGADPGRVGDALRRILDRPEV
ncbi:hypothetical protein AWW66_01115 [Micromonospora rosaria]|uniref:FAD-binding domain-containing protein n=1 Tax=Micromonospora rosaria TaxID=47874 RepID=A0A136PZD5_9ACTN|nr:FAD-dependent monooxygenase [Micromonospora rosaria]KXK63811.1 hypothetical protein AWW66_01115 [Micromonospora rosaria]